MLAPIRRLERAIPCHRAEAAITPIVGNFIHNWRLALERRERTPDIFDLIKDARLHHVPCHGFSSILHCLETCAAERRVPNPDYIILFYVHGYALSHNPFKAACRCGTSFRPTPGVYYPEPEPYVY